MKVDSTGTLERPRSRDHGRARTRLAAVLFETVWMPHAPALQFPALKLLPSEYLKRQMGATFMYEPSGLEAAYRFFGPDCLYWSTDFSAPGNLLAQLTGRGGGAVRQGRHSHADRRKITSENALRTFGLTH